MTVYVIAARRRDGIAWLRAHGHSEARAVLVSCSGFSGPERLAGRRITLDDRVVQLPNWRDGFNAPAVAQALADARGLWCDDCGQLIPTGPEGPDAQVDSWDLAVRVHRCSPCRNGRRTELAHVR